MGKTLVSGATVPTNGTAAIVAAINAVAGVHKFDPAAIAGVIHMESVWKTTCVTGPYIGLTQVGPDFVNHLGLNKAEFLALSAPEQIVAYGKWLDYYHFNNQLATHGIDLTTQPLARQAAFLQAMQFSPNGQDWKLAFANGDYSKPSTPYPQAQALGDTSIHDMENYYSGFFTAHPPVYQAAAPAMV
jgi:hypothetical protein